MCLERNKMIEARKWLNKESEVDLLLLMDSTGSMWGYIHEA